MSAFTPGLQLSEAFYHKAVRPVLEAEYPDLVYSAALIGSGSEVLGFDTAMSTDHGWGPRLQLFLSESDHFRYAERISETLRHHLPRTFRGYPVGFLPPTPEEPGTHMPDHEGSGPVNHRVEVHTLRGFVLAHLGFDLAADLDPADWLTFPAQKLRTLTAGAVYHDQAGLQVVRDRFAWYPHDVWLLLMAAGWNRISQEEHLMGRAGFVGDEMGSALIAARLVRDVMRQCFLMAREYAPYAKWFGTAFARLECASELQPYLVGALAAGTWQEREQHLASAFEALATMHNRLGLMKPLSPEVARFHNRPFIVLHAERFANALIAAIEDPAVGKIAARSLFGSIDQFSDSTDLLSDVSGRAHLRRLYE
jgi:hypothetical protein